MEKCRSCNEAFQPAEWQVKSGDYECKPCARERQKAYRLKRKADGNPVVSGKMGKDYHVEYMKKYLESPENREKVNAKMREYAKAPGTEKHHKARQLVRNAIRRGELTQESCEVCSHFPADAHHDDYDKPLDVRWLCRKHHAEHHARERASK